eukprot:CAMPEP_0174716100 /NCGR_PEP_ID=MMETSP1094-20130205/22867_1 /TAXON_ID=156173 /ORGANISM="Chrysochromulina brevifilum, Strain UTEX LB 985" /LENGTH=296 /DNA_ID=CAMNT_0015915779 /DNA_START=144 /DNA_END=1031 /DNA_ORIENTATION=-
MSAVVSEEALAGAGILVVCFIGSYAVIRSGCTLLPECSVAILVGMIPGAIFHFMNPSAEHSSAVEWWSFEPDAFFFVLLPPIIFDAGFSLKRRLFIQNLVPILTFAVIGTLISTAVVGGMLLAAGEAGWLQAGTLGLGSNSSNPQQALLFASLISAVDPVGTLAVLGSKDVNAHPTLQSILFGESVLNDAVAVVLFQTIQQMLPPTPNSNATQLTSAATADDSFSAARGFELVGRFVETSVCSTLIGVGMALLLSLLLRHSHFYEEAVRSLPTLTTYTHHLTLTTCDQLQPHSRTP